MKLNFHKLRYNIWMYFILFTLGIMCIVWFMQMIFTERYFLENTRANLVSTGKELAASYDNYRSGEGDSEEMFSAFRDRAVRAKEIDNIIVVVTTKDYNGESAKPLPEHCYPAEEAMLQYYGEYGNIINKAISHCEMLLSDEEEYYCGLDTSEENDTGEVYVYSAVIYQNTDESAGGTDSSGESAPADSAASSVPDAQAEPDGQAETDAQAEPVYVVLISSLENINSMLAATQKQLGIITLVIIVIAFFISMLIASSLSNPLVVMTDAAKRLARGDFTVEFTASGYSEIRELSDTLNRMKEDLQKTNTLQRELLANVTHDLKTPLTMVKAYAEMIKDISGDNKEKRDKHAQVIIDEADRLTVLVNDILNLSKVQANVDLPATETVNLSLLTAKVLDHFSSFSEKNGYTIHSEITPDLFTECDPQKIEQVIYNLVGNAINYTGDDKTVNVLLSLQDGKILLEVIDSGKGIDEEKIETIWQKYYRASETHKRPVKGTGLGLSIVKAILDAHGFRYGIISKKDEGSNFFVEFTPCAGDENE